MAITNGYCTLNELKTALAISVSDSVDDSMLEAIVETTSRMVDEYTGQFFYSTAGTAFYTPALNSICETHPFTAISSVATDDDGDGVYETVWTTADYYTQPYNAALFSKPYTALQVTPNGDEAFNPSVAKNVRLVATFGWASVPAPVRQATIMAATTVYEARKAPFGIVGSTEQGTIMRLSQRLHPEAALLLEPYRLHDGMAV